MLVLSRKANEKIVFPDIHASIQVVAIKGGVVRLGIEAPPEVKVIREEIMGQLKSGKHAEPVADLLGVDSRRRQLRHDLRNRLNAASIGLALLRRQLLPGSPNLDDTLDKLDQGFQALRQEFGQHMEALDESASRPAEKPHKALLVEDDRNECELMAGFLRLAGFEVDTAGDGAEALDYLSAHSNHDRPDVMLLDMGLPRCDGATIVRTVRRQPAYSSGFKIIAVSGHEPQEFRLDPNTARIDRWFQKPVYPETLLRELKQELSCVAA